MFDYRKTLNLPGKLFPMKANLPKTEIRRLNKWKEDNFYKKIKDSINGRKKFILHDGPPYANGDIHIGHATNKVLKDIIVRYKILSGFDASFTPGWDCHGLPIELKVDKIDDDLLFIKRCRSYAKSQVDLQKGSFIRLGIFADWDNPYLTMDHQYEANTIRILGKILANGYLFKGSKPVHWCTKCSSSLAEAEVEYRSKKSIALDVKFSVNNVFQWNKVFQIDNNKETSIVIWTTTPWTLPLNEAIAFEENTNYCVLEIGEENIIVGEKLIEKTVQRSNIKNFKVLSTKNGNSLKDLSVNHPIYRNKVVKLFKGSHVDTKVGTGFIHIAPAHGEEDFKLASTFHLPIKEGINSKGLYKGNVSLFSGHDISNVGDKVISLLEDNNKLLSIDNIIHSYPHCWRHFHPLIFRTTPQWFINMKKNDFKERLLKTIKKIEWIPSWGLKKMRQMLKERDYWCISRQRRWGTPLPVFENKKDGSLHPDTLEIIKKVAENVEKEGIEYWIHKGYELINYDKNYEQSTDTLDVWFDSGSSFQILKKSYSNYSADLYVEGHDQYRGWFQSSLITNLASSNIIPCKKVIAHGFALDKNGQKMSKSMGNIISPKEIVQSFGADIFRLFVASVDYTSDMSISNEHIQKTSETYRRIRNTVRFLISNLEDYSSKDRMSFSNLLEIDKWAISITKENQEKIISFYEENAFHKVVHRIHNFCSVEMGGFYLEIIKDRLYTCVNKSVSRKSAQNAIYHIIQSLVRWISPICCFTSEEILESLNKIGGKNEDKLFWYANLDNIRDHDVMNRKYWNVVKGIRNKCNQYLELCREQKIIKSFLEAEITIICDKKSFDCLKKLSDEIKFFLMVSKVDLIFDHLIKDENHLVFEVKKSVSIKCNRCWNRVDDVGSSAEYPDICKRCIKNIENQIIEERKFV